MKKLNLNSISVPRVEKKQKILTNFSSVRIDNYFWLNEKRNEDVINYIKAENSYTNKVMKKSEKIQKKYMMKSLLESKRIMFHILTWKMVIIITNIQKVNSIRNI